MDWLIDIWLIFLVAITIVFVIFAAKHVLFDDEELKRVPAEVIKKVLVVDDDEGFLNNLSEQLRDNHFQVCPASTVREAKQLMEQEHFRYVVTDLEMKTQNSEWGGIDVFKFLREKQLDANPIVLSGHS
ncbi:MAG: response regulator [Thiotrichaceae bacterium]